MPFHGSPQACSQYGDGAVQLIVLRNFVNALVAILLGNLLYLLVLTPVLPPAARHEVFRIDVGLAIDFAVCVAVYGVIALLTGHRSRHRH